MRRGVSGGSAKSQHAPVAMLRAIDAVLISARRVSLSSFAPLGPPTLPSLLNARMHAHQARHFLTVKQINASIDAMAQNKLNTLHLHLTDGESFTPNTDGWPTFPLLSEKGAYAPQLSYTKADFQAVVAHGRLRGVRVVPEFDLPVSARRRPVSIKEKERK